MTLGIIAGHLGLGDYRPLTRPSPSLHPITLPSKLLLVFIMYFERDIPTYHPQAVEIPPVRTDATARDRLIAKGELLAPKVQRGSVLATLLSCKPDRDATL